MCSVTTHSAIIRKERVFLFQLPFPSLSPQCRRRAIEGRNVRELALRFDAFRTSRQWDS